MVLCSAILIISTAYTSIQWQLRAVRRGHPDYIRPRNLVSTLGFPMRDATDRIRTIFALDRLSDAPYTDWEIETVRSIRELLKLFHRLLFTCADDEAAQLTSRTELQTLTPREMEIVNLLEQGITPANIAHISAHHRADHEPATFITSTKR